MKNILICTLKSWNIYEAEKLKKEYCDNYCIDIISDKDKLLDVVKECNPQYIFFPHWSYIIPKEVYENYECIVFHMTDLPFGRGGSPLQNLIVRGIKKTKISAIRVTEEIDAGPIYMKMDLELAGTAEQIFLEASKIIFRHMIPEIFSNQYVPKEQVGSVVKFERRKPEQSKLLKEMSMSTIYDYIRMLDAEGYPNAFIEWGKYILKFTNPKEKNGKITANVEIEEKNNET